MATKQKRSTSERRRGAAVIACLVLIVFLGTLSGIVVKTVLADRRETRMELVRRQAQMLLRDGLDRAETGRKIDPEFSGETLEPIAWPALPSGYFRLTSVYNEEKKAFDVVVLFLDTNGKTLLEKPLE